MTSSKSESRRRDLWLARLYYFTAMGGTGFIAPYLNLFFVRVGLSGTDIGLVAAVGSVAALVAAPVWASRSRTWRHPRAMLQLALTLVALSYLWLNAQRLFWGIALVMALRALVGSGISPLSDSLALAVTGANKTGFGSVRIWASLGWIFSVLVSGWLIERTGFVAAFIGQCLIIITGVFVLFPMGTQYWQDGSTGKKTTDLRVVIRDLLTNRPMVGLGLMLAVIGIGNSGVGQFETVYLSQLGAQDSLLGVAGMLSAVVEVPCMLWADRLSRRHGPHRLLLAAMWMTALLRGMVLVFPSVLTIMAERALGGISFSFYAVSLVNFIGEQTAPDQTGTALALCNVTLVSLIGVIGSPLAGTAFDAVGARWLYAIAAVGYLIGWLCLRLNRPAHSIV
jgi:MFS family permease